MSYLPEKDLRQTEAKPAQTRTERYNCGLPEYYLSRVTNTLLQFNMTQNNKGGREIILTPCTTASVVNNSLACTFKVHA